ncbi:MAG: acetate--CoA ligase family protein [Planctomycetales bacterium]
MKFRRELVLRGPNVWSPGRVLEWQVGAGGVALPDPQALGVIRRTFDEIRAACAPSDAPFPSVVTHVVHGGAPRDRAAAELFVRLVLELQRLTGPDPARGWVECDGCDGTVTLAVEVREEQLARECVAAATHIYEGAVRGAIPPLEPIIDHLRELAEEVCLGPTTGPIAAAALARGIPMFRLDSVSLIQLGHGARQKRLQTAITDRASYIGESLSRDKELTKQLLRRFGIPVPAGGLAATADEAWGIASAVGLPVVVKPRDADYGNGVSLRLMTQDAVAEAFDKAHKYSPQVLVEQQLSGAHFRLLVVGDRVVGGVRREPAHVVGDGHSTVAQLIDAANRDPLRGADYTFPRQRLHVEAEELQVLAEQGFDPDSVAPAGEIVLLHFETHTRGATNTDVTEEVHPATAATAVDACRIVGLDVAGIDLIAADIGRPLDEQNGGILEVNAGPAIVLHMAPLCQPPRPVAEAIVESLFPPADTGRIPLVAVVSAANGSGLAQRIGGLWGVAQGTTGPSMIGLADAAGLHLGSRRIKRGDCRRADDVQSLLMHPDVTGVVCDVDCRRIRVEGLAFDECRAVVLDGLDEYQPIHELIGEEGLAAGEAAPCSPTQRGADRRRGLSVLLSAISRDGAIILNVDDSEVAALYDLVGERALPVSRDPEHPLLRRARDSGRPVAFWREGLVVHAWGDCERCLLPTGPIKTLPIGPHEQTTELLSQAALWAISSVPHAPL